MASVFMDKLSFAVGLYIQIHPSPFCKTNPEVDSHQTNIHTLKTSIIIHNIWN